MSLSFETYRDKVLGCWNGKNIGGTLGAPFECKRGVFDLSFYAQELTEPLPNDDLDLHLVWLAAAERHGRRINSAVLAEYWLSYIVPDMAEYGAGKVNLRAGLVPPLSGFVDNLYRNSCGSFILSEIWACLTPGHPRLAAALAYEDAVVDHSHEGLYAEVFCAAVESAAFFEGDALELIRIGLSYIPGDCAVAKAVHTVLEAHSSGKAWTQARKMVLNAVPGSFGALGTPREEIPDDEPIGEMGFDAPSNIGILLIGWLYGEGDFGKSICIAAGCGEDADCTAGTLGAILGILYGNSRIDEKWLAPLGGKIKTVCIDRTKHLPIPATTEEMTRRVVRLAPEFLPREACDLMQGAGFTVEPCKDGFLCRPDFINVWYERPFSALLAQSPFTVSYDFQIFKVLLDYGAEPFVREGEPFPLRLVVENMEMCQQWLEFRWLLPEGWEVSPAPRFRLGVEQRHCNIPVARTEFTITPHTLRESRYDVVLQILSHGHPTQGLIPLVFFVGR